MPRAIAIPDLLVSRLESTARSRQTTLDALVVTILDRAIAMPEMTPEWLELNKRRASLIYQRFETGLNSEEAAELQHLQELVDAQAESMDAVMLNDVDMIHDLVERKLIEPVSE